MSDVEHAAEQAHEHAHSNKEVALLISVLALMLAISEILGQRAMTETLQKNIEASNLWSHFQAKTIRMTVAESSADHMAALLTGISDPKLKQVMQTQITSFRNTAARMETDPMGKDGRRELTEQAREAELVRDRMGKKHNRFELATGAFQIGIVLASATVITGIAALLWASGVLGVLGAVMMIAGMIA